MKAGQLCEECGVAFRNRSRWNAELVCNCSARESGHRLYPVCNLEPGKKWDDCLCAQIAKADRPCMSCEAMLLSAQHCPKCLEEVTARIIRAA